MSENFVDQESVQSLTSLDEIEEILKNQFSGVRTVLVVMSAAAIVYDIDSLRQHILAAYSDAATFFRTTQGKPLGVSSPQSVDLLVDLTGPGQRQGIFYAKKMRKISKYAVGRNAGFFRRKIYDRIFDEKASDVKLPMDVLERERFVQRKVFALAGVPLLPAGATTPDLSREIALSLPKMANRSIAG